MGLFDSVVRSALPWLPKAIVWVVARRYVAGSELEQALQRITALRGSGFDTILDELGEAVEEAGQAEAAVLEYERAMDALDGLDPICSISVKPTHLGLLIDRELCERLLSRLCVRAAAADRKVRFEMEDSPTIDSTLAVYRKLRGEHPNLGIVLQSRLFRTADDVEALLELGSGLDVRLVKGIYIEPPEIAWTDPADISKSFIDLARRLVDGGAFVAFATHDSAVADACAEIVRQAGRSDVPANERSYEFQLLMGVRAGEAQRLRLAGHRVRVYVPYGKDWYAYSMRRLSRNPEIARHVIRALISRP